MSSVTGIHWAAELMESANSGTTCFSPFLPRSSSALIFQILPTSRGENSQSEHAALGSDETHPHHEQPCPKRSNNHMAQLPKGCNRYWAPSTMETALARPGDSPACQHLGRSGHFGSQHRSMQDPLPRAIVAPTASLQPLCRAFM